MSLDEKLKKATGVVCKQGVFPFPLSDTAIEIIDRVVGKNEEELDLIYAFRENPSQALEQLTASSGFDSPKAERSASALAKKGLVFIHTNSAGKEIYRLMPFMTVGLMEYLFMGELTGSQEEKELAALFEKMLDGLREKTQENYDALVPHFQKIPSPDRTVPIRKTKEGHTINIIPVDKSIPIQDEFILPSQSVEEIINKSDYISVGNCFCRQKRLALGYECGTKAPIRTCFSFGKSARFTAEQGFARAITREEALRIIREAEDAGLVHKAFHPLSREESPEIGLCNCCKDCCDAMNLWRNGALPLVNSTYHLSVVHADRCVGCGTCEEVCPTEAIRVGDDGIAAVDDTSCFGCGVCSRFCPEMAISLKEGLRRVFILPPRLRR